MILSRALIESLAREGHVDGASARDLGTVATAVAVRTGDALPSISNADALRTALLDADAIHFPDPGQATAGIHFAKVLERLGICDQVAGRLRPAPNGATAMRALAGSKGRRPVGCTQATEILTTPGIVLVAPLPHGCELTTIYTAAITAKAQAPREAAELIRRLTGPEGTATWHRLGFA
jgi:molybdate transport system substrate-binding protein